MSRHLCPYQIGEGKDVLVSLVILSRAWHVRRSQNLTHTVSQTLRIVAFSALSYLTVGFLYSHSLYSP
jgi:hypothetical protein